MDVRKLYYEDCHLKNFTARVTSCCETDRGYLITLDATAFYPEGGGQPADHGTLGTVKVLDVQEQDGNVCHLCDGPLEVGSMAEGTVDWERRFDLMQQHSGEHMVSGVVHKKYGYHNVGFHMGKEYITIDLDGVIPQEDLQEIENTVNGFIWQNIALHCWVPSREELPQVVYRTKRELPWPVRIVEIPGVDSCACCGVQVERTGEVGLVKLFSCVKFHEGVRIEMACGKRALTLLNQAYDQNRQVSQLFSAKIPETAAAAARINQQLSELKFQNVGLQKKVLAGIAAKMAGRENPVLLEDGLNPGQVRELADAVAENCRGAATVLSGSDDTGYSICIVSKTLDVRPVGKAAAEALSGRGGGKPGAFQGNLRTSRRKIEEYFHLL